MAGSDCETAHAKFCATSSSADVCVCAAAAFQREKRVRVYETDNDFKLRKVTSPDSISVHPARLACHGLPCAPVHMTHTTEQMAGTPTGRKPSGTLTTLQSGLCTSELAQGKLLWHVALRVACNAAFS